MSGHGATRGAHGDALVARLRAAGCVFAEEEAALLVAEAADRRPDAEGDARAAELEGMTAARVAGEPLETVLGWAAFAGRRIVVRPGVFVPRRRTERLARAAVAAARAVREPVVVDLCCGSGAIGAVVADEVPGAILHAADVDPVAVACAGENLLPRGAAVHRGDLMAALPAELRGRIHVLVANVPYVPRAGLALMPPEARLHEPESTRDGGEDGLDVLRRVAREGGPWLAPTGVVLVEVADAQVPGALEAMRAAGLDAGIERASAADDEDDDGTFVVASRVVR
ncbi:putative protein N(5)-glutamine methyltransferase [Clavibacter michiganensis]|uniref:putative protein N(5)-glutamine methyltransferase n=1 Tax=Clavibacter michiganensis TaxID=28447 RepID=UPI001AE325FA|nr:putative protein N(5)-glutamine methyltransferase [Clavibacter michiganensis]